MTGRWLVGAILVAGLGGCYPVPATERVGDERRPGGAGATAESVAPDSAAVETARVEPPLDTALTPPVSNHPAGVGVDSTPNPKGVRARRATTREARWP